MSPTRSTLAPLAVLLALASVAHAQSSSSAIEQAAKLVEAGKYAEAKPLLEPAAKTSHAAAYWLGRVYAGQQPRDLDKSVDLLERAVKMHDQSSDYYLWLGRGYCQKAQSANKLKQPFLAKNCKNAWDRAIALDPNNLEAREDIIEFYLEAPGIMGGSKEKARAEAQEIKKRDFARGTAAAASVATRTQDTVGAEREWQAYIKERPDSSAGYVMLAVMYTQQQKYEQALATLDRRLKARPDDKAALYGVGRLGAVSGQYLDRAEAALKQYIADPPKANATLTGAHYRLGMVYQKKGATAAARQEYEAALKLDPNYADAKKALGALK